MSEPSISPSVTYMLGMLQQLPGSTLDRLAIFALSIGDEEFQRHIVHIGKELHVSVEELNRVAEEVKKAAGSRPDEWCTRS